MTRTRLLRIAVVLTATTLLAGCGGSDGATGDTTSAVAVAEDPTEPVDEGTDAADPELDPKVQEFVDEFESLQKTLETYWADQIDGYEAPSDTLVFSGGTDDPSTFPTCGDEPVEAENGFYCPPDNTVILDADWMYSEYTDIGDTFLYVVLAHEYGHSAQANLSSDAAPAEADEEIQADCFSGAFLQDVIDTGEITEEDGDEQEVNLTLATAAGDFGTTDSHGTLASRASAFEYGRSEGAAACLQVDDYRR